MNSDDEENVVAGVIKDLIKRVETFERANTEAFKAFEDSASKHQNAFETNITALFTALRQDIYRSYLELKLEHDNHNAKHLIDEQRIENDKLAREHRQFTLNVILAGIIGLIVAGFIITGLLIWLIK